MRQKSVSIFFDESLLVGGKFIAIHPHGLLSRSSTQTFSLFFEAVVVLLYGMMPRTMMIPFHIVR
jgi:hypothetical protein